MGRKDFFFAGAFAAMLLAVLAPAWFKPRQLLANFGDLYAYHYPLRHLLASTVASGRLPFWNPYIFSGLPLAANPQGALYYPISLFGMIFPLTLAISWDYAFHLFWSGLGMALLARRAGLNSPGAWLLAVLYAFSPFLIYRITAGIPTLLAAMSWAPWCWLAFFSGLPGLLAGTWALQLFSGHAQFLFINGMGLALWILWFRPAALAVLLYEGLAALMLSTVFWAPLREFLAHSIRMGWPLIFTTAYSFDPASLLTWLRPDAWGNPLAKTYLPPPSVFFETNGVFIGWGGLLLSIVGLRGRRGRAAWVLIGAGLFLALGGHNPAYPFLLKHTPLGIFRTPSRYLFLCLLGLIFAAGSGWRRLQNGGEGARLLRAGILAAAVIQLLAWDRRFLRVEDADPYLMTRPALARLISGKPIRVLTDPELFNPNKTLLYRAMNVNGYEAFFLGAYAEYAARSEGRAAVDPSRSYLRDPNSRQMKQLGVAYRIAPAGAIAATAPYGLSYFADDSGAIPAVPLKVTVLKPELWRIEGSWAAAASRLVVAQPAYPGWRAWLNGEPVSLKKWEGFLMAAAAPKTLLPGQEFELNLKFAPTGWALWVSLTLLCWLAWLGSWGRRLSA